jgi:hypothetical protein
MFTKKSMFLLPVLVLLFLSLVTTASTAGTRVAAQGGAQIEHLTVYIHTLQPAADGKLTLTADQIEWYQGADADRIFAEREPEAYAETGGALDDYYIVNDSDQLSAYPVADNAKVTMQIFDHTGNIEDLDIHWNESIPLQRFTKEFAKSDVFDLSGSPYHLTIENGVITSIVQQYTP